MYKKLLMLTTLFLNISATVIVPIQENMFDLLLAKMGNQNATIIQLQLAGTKKQYVTFYVYKDGFYFEYVHNMSTGPKKFKPNITLITSDRLILDSKQLY